MNDPATINNEALILVLGAARSGTTMLDLMLGNSSDVFSCGEVWCHYRPHREHHFELQCLCGDPSCEIWANLSRFSESEFHRAALNQPGINYVVDSSKDLRWALNSNRWAAQSNTRVVNVVTWKDPIDLAYSHWKRGRPIHYYRKAFVRYYGRLLDVGLPFVALSYSRIIADPSSALRALCEHIGMQYKPGREEFWNKRHHQLFGSAGTAKQVSSGNSKLDSKREFPASFLNAFEESMPDNGADKRIDDLIAQLREREVGNSPSAVGSIYKQKTIRPLWYYYHWMKSIYRKWVPYPGPVMD